MVKKRKVTKRVQPVSKAKTISKPVAQKMSAGIWRRFGGFLIDYLLIGIPNSVIVWILKDNGWYTPIALYYNTLLAAIILFYFIFFTYKNNGQTFGKMIAGTKVVGFGGQHLTLRKIIIRYGFLFCLVQFPAIFKLLTGVSLGIGFLVINILAILLLGILLIIDDEHRGLHDRVGETWVVRK